MATTMRGRRRVNLLEMDAGKKRRDATRRSQVSSSESALTPRRWRQSCTLHSTSCFSLIFHVLEYVALTKLWARLQECKDSMTRNYAQVIVLSSVLVTACEFKNTTELFTPTAPSASSESAASATSAGSASSSSSSTSVSTSGFEGSWTSGNLPGLPQISSCTDLEWSISSQSAASVSGVLSAVCGGVADITANLTGEMAADDVINLSAKGEAIGLGLTCGFDLTGVGRRESDDAWRLNYQGLPDLAE